MSKKTFSETFKEGWLDEDPRIVAASLLGIFTFIILNILLYKSEKRKKNLKQQSIENNTAIEGRVVDHGKLNDSDDSKRTYYYYGTYEYTVNGKIKKYRIHSESRVPNTIKLYPKNSSMTKFFSDYDKLANAAIAFNALAAIAVCIFTLLLTGYINF